jgi:hypothetical protein
LVSILLLAHAVTSQAQVQLPKQRLLDSAGIQKITIYKKALRYQGPFESVKENPPLDTTRTPFKVFYLGRGGRIDSVDMGYKTLLYGYDSLNRMIYTATRDDVENKILNRARLKQLDSGVWYLRSYAHGQLSGESWTTPDSLVFKRISHRVLSNTDYYTVYKYNFAKNEESTTAYSQGVFQWSDTLRWLTKDGVPYRMIHIKHEPFEKKKTTRVELPVDSAGQPINKLNGTIFDPYRSDNYYTRHEKMKGFRQGSGIKFTKDTMLASVEKRHLWTFDGVSIIYRYSFVYE